MNPPNEKTNTSDKQTKHIPKDKETNNSNQAYPVKESLTEEDLINNMKIVQSSRELRRLLDNKKADIEKKFVNKKLRQIKQMQIEQTKKIKNIDDEKKKIEEEEEKIEEEKKKLEKQKEILEERKKYLEEQKNRKEKEKEKIAKEEDEKIKDIEREIDFEKEIEVGNIVEEIEEAISLINFKQNIKNIIEKDAKTD